MIENLPHWINILFIVTTITTIGIYHYANNKPIKTTLVILIWAIGISILAYSGFFENTEGFPPRFAFVIFPTTIAFVYGLFPTQRKAIIANRQINISTFLHIVRIPVEIVLLYLFLNGAVPELMTFEGRNFDILAGITAPIIGLLYLKNKLPKNILIVWNVICLCLVSFILVNGLLSAPLAIQQFGFEQPNIAVIYFPFVLLPAVVVPLVIWTHITDIIKLTNI